MNWAEDSDPAGGEDAYPEGDAGLDDPTFDEPTGDDEMGGFDAEDDTLDDGDTVDDTDDSPVSADTADEPDSVTADDPAAESNDVAPLEITDDEVVGTDPDTDLAADDPAFTAEFPPDIALDPRPEPVDGAPWSDAGLLGNTVETGTDWVALDYAAPPVDDLVAMDGAAGGDWNALADSPDPAMSSLARWWQPT